MFYSIYIQHILYTEVESLKWYIDPFFHSKSHVIVHDNSEYDDNNIISILY